MTYKDNPEYKEVFSCKEGDKEWKFYEPVDLATGYHLSRFAAAQAQAIYASSGITVDMIKHIANALIKMGNDPKASQATLRTDIGLIGNQLLYRTQYPVDNDCSIRMAAVYLLAEGEDPNVVKDSWTQKKVQLAKDNPDAYAFFLDMGIKHTPKYLELLEALNDADYFRTREEVIRSTTPSLLQPK